MTPTGKNFFILVATIGVIILAMVAYFMFGHRSAFAPDNLGQNPPTQTPDIPSEKIPPINQNNPPKENGVACTMEAKLCPDGSYVGRTGPNCEFSPCPGFDAQPKSLNSGIQGTAMLGPTCPVIQFGAEEECRDKPFTETLIVLNSSQKEVKQFTPNAKGEFKVILPAGTYTIISSLKKILPRCHQEVSIEFEKFTNITIDCDTGIR